MISYDVLSFKCLEPIKIMDSHRGTPDVPIQTILNFLSIRKHNEERMMCYGMSLVSGLYTVLCA